MDNDQLHLMRVSCIVIISILSQTSHMCSQGPREPSIIRFKALGNRSYGLDETLQPKLERTGCRCRTVLHEASVCGMFAGVYCVSLESLLVLQQQSKQTEHGDHSNQNLSGGDMLRGYNGCMALYVSIC